MESKKIQVQADPAVLRDRSCVNVNDEHDNDKYCEADDDNDDDSSVCFLGTVPAKGTTGNHQQQRQPLGEVVVVKHSAARTTVDATSPAVGVELTMAAAASSTVTTASNPHSNSRSRNEAAVLLISAGEPVKALNEERNQMVVEYQSSSSKNKKQILLLPPPLLDGTKKHQPPRSSSNIIRTSMKNYKPPPVNTCAAVPTPGCKKVPPVLLPPSPPLQSKLNETASASPTTTRTPHAPVTAETSTPSTTKNGTTASGPVAVDTVAHSFLVAAAAAASGGTSSRPEHPVHHQKQTKVQQAALPMSGPTRPSLQQQVDLDTAEMLAIAVAGFIVNPAVAARVSDNDDSADTTEISASSSTNKAKKSDTDVSTKTRNPAKETRAKTLEGNTFNSQEQEEKTTGAAFTAAGQRQEGIEGTSETAAKGSGGGSSSSTTATTTETKQNISATNHTNYWLSSVGGGALTTAARKNVSAHPPRFDQQDALLSLADTEKGFVVDGVDITKPRRPRPSCSSFSQEKHDDHHDESSYFHPDELNKKIPWWLPYRMHRIEPLCSCNLCGQVIRFDAKKICELKQHLRDQHVAVHDAILGIMVTQEQDEENYTTNSTLPLHPGGLPSPSQAVFPLPAPPEETNEKHAAAAEPDLVVSGRCITQRHFSLENDSRYCDPRELKRTGPWWLVVHVNRKYPDLLCACNLCGLAIHLQSQKDACIRDHLLEQHPEFYEAIQKLCHGDDKRKVDHCNEDHDSANSKLQSKRPRRTTAGKKKHVYVPDPIVTRTKRPRLSNKNTGMLASPTPSTCQQNRSSREKMLLTRDEDKGLIRDRLYELGQQFWVYEQAADVPNRVVICRHCRRQYYSSNPGSLVSTLQSLYIHLQSDCVAIPASLRDQILALAFAPRGNHAVSNRVYLESVFDRDVPIVDPNDPSKQDKSHEGDDDIKTDTIRSAISRESVNNVHAADVQSAIAQKYGGARPKPAINPSSKQDSKEGSPQGESASIEKALPGGNGEEHSAKAPRQLPCSSNQSNEDNVLGNVLLAQPEDKSLIPEKLYSIGLNFWLFRDSSSDIDIRRLVCRYCQWSILSKKRGSDVCLHKQVPHLYNHLQFDCPSCPQSVRNDIRIHRATATGWGVTEASDMPNNDFFSDLIWERRVPIYAGPVPEVIDMVDEPRNLLSLGSVQEDSTRIDAGNDFFTPRGDDPVPPLSAASTDAKKTMGLVMEDNNAVEGLSSDAIEEMSIKAPDANGRAISSIPKDSLAEPVCLCLSEDKGSISDPFFTIGRQFFIHTSEDNSSDKRLLVCRHCQWSIAFDSFQSAARGVGHIYTHLEQSCRSCPEKIRRLSKDFAKSDVRVVVPARISLLEFMEKAWGRSVPVLAGELPSHCRGRFRSVCTRTGDDIGEQSTEEPSVARELDDFDHPHKVRICRLDDKETVRERFYLMGRQYWIFMEKGGRRRILICRHCHWKQTVNTPSAFTASCTSRSYSHLEENCPACPPQIQQKMRMLSCTETHKIGPGKISNIEFCTNLFERELPVYGGGGDESDQDEDSSQVIDLAGSATTHETESIAQQDASSLAEADEKMVLSQPEDKGLVREWLYEVGLHFWLFRRNDSGVVMVCRHCQWQSISSSVLSFSGNAASMVSHLERKCTGCSKQIRDHIRAIANQKNAPQDCISNLEYYEQVFERNAPIYCEPTDTSSDPEDTDRGSNQATASRHDTVRSRRGRPALPKNGISSSKRILLCLPEDKAIAQERIYQLGRHFWIFANDDGNSRSVVCRYCQWKLTNGSPALLATNVARLKEHLLRNCDSCPPQVRKTIMVLQSSRSFNRFALSNPEYLTRVWNRRVPMYCKSIAPCSKAELRHEEDGATSLEEHSLSTASAHVDDFSSSGAIVCDAVLLSQPEDRGSIRERLYLAGQQFWLFESSDCGSVGRLAVCRYCQWNQFCGTPDLLQRSLNRLYSHLSDNCPRCPADTRKQMFVDQDATEICKIAISNLDFCRIIWNRVVPQWTPAGFCSKKMPTRKELLKKLQVVDPNDATGSLLVNANNGTDLPQWNKSFGGIEGREFLAEPGDNGLIRKQLFISGRNFWLFAMASNTSSRVLVCSHCLLTNIYSSPEILAKMMSALVKHLLDHCPCCSKDVHEQIKLAVNSETNQKVKKYPPNSNFCSRTWKREVPICDPNDFRKQRLDNGLSRGDPTKNSPRQKKQGIVLSEQDSAHRVTGKRKVIRPDRLSETDFYEENIKRAKLNSLVSYSPANDTAGARPRRNASAVARAVLRETLGLSSAEDADMVGNPGTEELNLKETATCNSPQAGTGQEPGAATLAVASGVHDVQRTLHHRRRNEYDAVVVVELSGPKHAAQFHVYKTEEGEAAYSHYIQKQGRRTSQAERDDVFRNSGDVFVAVNNVPTAGKPFKEVEAMIRHSLFHKKPFSWFRMRDCKFGRTRARKRSLDEILTEMNVTPSTTTSRGLVFRPKQADDADGCVGTEMTGEGKCPAAGSNELTGRRRLKAINSRKTLVRGTRPHFSRSAVGPVPKPFLVHDTDVTQLPESWFGVPDIHTPHQEKSLWYLPFHIDRGTVAACSRRFFVCNLCGETRSFLDSNHLRDHLKRNEPLHRATLAAIRNAIQEGSTLQSYFCHSQDNEQAGGTAVALTSTTTYQNKARLVQTKVATLLEAIRAVAGPGPGAPDYRAVYEQICQAAQRALCLPQVAADNGDGDEETKPWAMPN